MPVSISCEFYEISKNTFLHRTALLTASVNFFVISMKGMIAEVPRFLRQFGSKRIVSSTENEATGKRKFFENEFNIVDLRKYQNEFRF